MGPVPKCPVDSGLAECMLWTKLDDHWLALMGLVQMEKEHGSEDTSDVTPGSRAVSSGDKLINPQYAQPVLGEQ